MTWLANLVSITPTRQYSLPLAYRAEQEHAAMLVHGDNVGDLTQLIKEKKRLKSSHNLSASFGLGSGG